MCYPVAVGIEETIGEEIGQVRIEVVVLINAVLITPTCVSVEIARVLVMCIRNVLLDFVKHVANEAMTVGVVTVRTTVD